MGHMAKIEAGVVVFVTVSRDEDDDREQEISAHTGETYRRTSYNTHGGQHANGGTPFRYNYAGIGYTFSDAPKWAAQGGAFIPPQPFPSWVLNPDTALWDAPVPMPAEGGPWSWDEDSLSWVEVEPLT
jgi:hypothetical protein